MKSIKLIFLLFFLSSTSFAQEVQAPFGLTWGMLQDEFAGSECTKQDALTLCTVTDVPRPISIGESYILIFAPNRGLQKVSMIGVTIDNDITGSEGKESYATFKSALADRYGTPDEFEWSGRELYDEYDEFYQCLRYQGCGYWTSIWHGENIDGTVAIELKGLQRGEGYITLTYESKDWSTVVDEAEAATRENDLDAL